MARKRSGLTIGQSLTLVFGFVLGSVMIFALGIWVGRDFSRQRDAGDRAVVVRRVASPQAPRATLPVRGPAAATPGGAVAAADSAADERPTRPRFASAATATTTRTAPPSHTPSRVPTRPPTPRRTEPPSPPPAPTAMPRRPIPTPALSDRSDREAGGMWTVQAATTTDQVQALVAARRLRAKGYDAFTSQTDIGGVPWYRIQVGRFQDRREAEAMVERLRREGMSAAFADRIR